MKSLFLYGFFLLFLPNLADAAARSPLPAYIGWATTVYVARVDSVEGDKVTFSVTQTLRGDNVATLPLFADPIWKPYLKPNSEWLLISCSKGSPKNSVGWLMDGYCGWLPYAVVRDGDQVYVQDGMPNKLQISPHGLTLEQNKNFLENNPYKH